MSNQESLNKEIKKKDYLNIIFFGQKIKNQIAQYQRRINRLEAKKMNDSYLK